MSSLRAVSPLLLCMPLASQSTWVVDSAGSGQFVDIPPAIAAAAPGDRIVVLGTSTYSAFVVDRGVDVEAAAGAVTPTIEVVGVPADARARVAGFRVQRQGGVRSVSVRDCAGAVLLVDLVEFGAAFPTAIGRPGLEVLASARVFVAGGTFRGQSGTSHGGAGLLLDGSRAFVRGATFVGGSDVSIYPSVGARGLAGILLRNGSHAMLGDVSATGGSAGIGDIQGGDGGHGLEAYLGCLATVVEASEFVATPGAWGSVYWGDDGYAITGPVRYTDDCTLTGEVWSATEIPARARLDAPPAVAVGAVLHVAVRGAPGGLVVLGADLAFGYVPLAPLDGALALTPAAVIVGVLRLGPLGDAGWDFTVPNIPSALHVDVFCQGAEATAAGVWLLAPIVSHTF